MKHVIVTGGNGHLGFSLIKELLQRGYHVRATVRDPEDPRKSAHLKELGVEPVQADLGDPASLDRALDGMEGLFQVAAVFDLTAENPEEEVVRPNLEGTRNILEAAHRAGIQKVVYTSSIASVGVVSPGEPPLDESHWNDGAVEPYAISKTRSEKLAWELSERLGIPMVAVLPATMIGPDCYRLTSSLQLLKDMLDGNTPMAFPMELNFVDVRDVAIAHILAYESAAANGRYIAAGETLSIAEVCRIVKSIRPETKVSDRTMPAWLVRFLPAIDALVHKITGAPRRLKRELIAEYLNRSQSYGSVRLKEELGWAVRPIQTSFQETIDWMTRPDIALSDGKKESQKS